MARKFLELCWAGEGNLHFSTAFSQNLASATGSRGPMGNLEALFLPGRQPSDWELEGAEPWVCDHRSPQWSFCLTELGRGREGVALVQML